MPNPADPERMARAERNARRKDQFFLSEEVAFDRDQVARFDVPQARPTPEAEREQDVIPNVPTAEHDPTVRYFQKGW